MTKRDALWIAALYLAWLAAAYAINSAATGARTPDDVFHAWVRFDGIYFRAIAEHGYAEASRIIRYQQGFPFLTAAFPLFPLLIHLAVPLFAGDYTVAAVIVPQALTLLALCALFNLVLLDFPKSVAWLTILSLITFPTFYFLLAPYSESLFLLLVILTCYFYRRQQLWIVGLIGALAAAARIVGAPLLLGAFALDMLRVTSDEWRVTSGEQHALRITYYASRFMSLATRHSPLLLIPLGLLVYMAYQWWDFGDPLIFLRGHASSEWKVGFDLLGFFRGLALPFYNLLSRDWTSPVFRTNIFNSIFFYFGIVVTVCAWRKLPPVYSLFGALAIVLPTLTGSLISMPRFLLISFPLFLSMGIFFAAHPRARILLVPLGLAGLAATWLFF
ncbi:MAG: hypothetical protein ABI874_09815, partial [Chloroflexota bacterium]